ncbi:MAG: peptide chain release factor N(5)-glutamine methyltransferase [Nannocystis sp.]|nr:peptide chain release factor N(5)-glutamine methyltransferase [Nannocystis sp.]
MAGPSLRLAGSLTLRPCQQHLDPSRGQAWTVGELLAWTTERFLKAGIEEARVDAQHLLAHALGCTRMELYLRHDALIGEAERAPLRELVRRRLSREPVAYIVGRRGFHALDLELAVDGRVLVPRPGDGAPGGLGDRAAAEPGRRADGGGRGHGLGAIALAIARARPAARVIAVDRSEDALAVALANAERLGAAIECVRSDLLAGLTPPAGGFDAVLANLPYIPTQELAGLDPEVRDFEPHAALDGGADGLRLIVRLIDACAAPGVLRGSGRLFWRSGPGRRPRCWRRWRAAATASARYAATTRRSSGWWRGSARGDRAVAADAGQTSPSQQAASTSQASPRCEQPIGSPHSSWPSLLLS